MTNSNNSMMNTQESNIKKPKKTINVSIQSKKYSAPINRILDKWEKNGLNASNEVSENILLVDKLNKSITFCSMFNIYELVEKMVGLYDDLDSPSAFMKIESILSEVITIDNSKLNNVLAKLNEEYMGNKKEVKIEDNYNSNNNMTKSIDYNVIDYNHNLNNNQNYKNNDYVQSVPQRRSPQSTNQDDISSQNDGYNKQSSSNYHNNNNNNNNYNYDNNDNIEQNIEEKQIPANFLFND